MTWWQKLRREPPPPRGRRHAGTPPDPAELTERLTGMLAAYVRSGDDPGPVAPTAPGAHDEQATDSDAPVAGEGTGTVVLGFADGSSVALAPGDSRARPFVTLTDALTSR